MPYKFLEDIATADIAFEVSSEDLNKLFEEAGFALSESMIKTEDLSSKIKRRISLENKNIDRLLFDFLAEIIFLKDSETLVFKDFNVDIKKNEIYKLKAKLSGEIIDCRRHELRNDVKAVTFHRFEVKKENEKWKARVILDI